MKKNKILLIKIEFNIKYLQFKDLSSLNLFLLKNILFHKIKEK